MKILHPYDGHDGTDDIYTPTYQACKDQGVDVRDPVPQEVLARQLGKAGLMVLPTGYPEICSNSILQSLACGTPVVTTGNMGSACEWVWHGKNGMLTQTHLEDYAVHLLEIARNASAVLVDRKRHERMCRSATKTKGLFTWGEIGRKWKTMMERLY